MCPGAGLEGLAPVVSQEPRRSSPDRSGAGGVTGAHAAAGSRPLRLDATTIRKPDATGQPAPGRWPDSRQAHIAVAGPPHSRPKRRACSMTRSDEQMTPNTQVLASQRECLIDPVSGLPAHPVLTGRSSDLKHDDRPLLCRWLLPGPLHDGPAVGRHRAPVQSPDPRRTPPVQDRRGPRPRCRKSACGPARLNENAGRHSAVNCFYGTSVTGGELGRGGAGLPWTGCARAGLRVPARRLQLGRLARIRAVRSVRISCRPRVSPTTGFLIMGGCPQMWRSTAHDRGSSPGLGRRL
jgi:hypothetical protein